MRVSIVIPCRNEERYIGKCLSSIVNADWQKSELEVLVCDGKSTDNSASIIQNFCKSNEYMHLLINEPQTTPFALNLGIRNSIGEVIIILGAHSEIYPDFVFQNVQSLNAHPECVCVGGSIENFFDNESSRIISLALSSQFGIGNAKFRLNSQEGYADTVAFGAYRKEVFERIGLFDQKLTRNQDDDFNFRLTKAGYKIFFNPLIRCKYIVRSSFKKLSAQYKQYGYWKAYLNRKHKTLLSFRQIIPFLFVTFLIAGFPVCFFLKSFFWIYGGTIVLYLLCGIYFALTKSKWRDLPILLFVFFLLHWGYGIGYAKGAWDFVLLQKKTLPKTPMTR